MRKSPEQLAALHVRAEHGDAFASYELGRAYLFGLGVEVDVKLAEEWLTRAAEGGVIGAQQDLAFFKINRPDSDSHAVAAHWYGRAAKAGSPEGQLRYAQCLATGSGVAVNLPAAADWFRAAAAQGLLEALDLLGDLEAARGDPIAAARSYRQAAEAGLPSAQHHLGLALIEGRGVVRDNAEGLEWLTAAAERRSADAAFTLGTLYSDGTLGRDLALAERWWRTADANGHPRARLKLAALRDERRKSDEANEHAKFGEPAAHSEPDAHSEPAAQSEHDAHSEPAAQSEHDEQSEPDQPGPRVRKTDLN